MATLTMSEVHATQGQSYPLLQPVATSPATPVPSSKPAEAAVLYGTYACGPMDMVFAIVRLSATQQGCETADYQSNQPVLGIIVNKPTGLQAQVVSLGALKGFANLVIGARYFLGPNGRLITPPLTDPNMLYVHPVGTAIAEDTLFVQPNWPIVRRLA
ncbi:MAG: hypothetical protein EOO38_00255 [Cytophagaceae bacterium]|nr:MAG: hypothetical protein EOO38_00255 [Cytophagaceae bacterium]